MTVLVDVLVGLLVVSSVVAVTPLPDDRLSRAVAVSCAGLLAALAVCAVVSGALFDSASLGARLLTVALFCISVLGGSPVTATVLWIVDRGSSRPHALDRAGEVLRGGAWIGAFERAGAFAALASGWPEGLAVVLALKGLGRYSELRAAPGSTGAASGGVAERFLIGSFASLLWGCACAGISLALVY